MLKLIAGPCSAETKEQVIDTALQLNEIKEVRWYRAGVWKSRTRPNTYEGAESTGLSWLKDVKKLTRLKVITEVMTPKQAEQCLDADLDGFWLGARTSTNPFYVSEIAKSLQGVKNKDIDIFIKNPLNPDINLWTGAIERMLNSNIGKIYTIFRGYSLIDNGKYRNTPYWKHALEIKRRFPQIEMFCDPSHIAGKQQLIAEIAQTALNLDFSGLMIECHNKPALALSDKEQQLTPKELSELLNKLVLPQKKDRKNTELELMREEITGLDCELLSILKKRLILCEDIATIKQKNNLPLFQMEQFKRKTEQFLSFSDGQILTEDFLKELFELIHLQSLKIQNDRL